MRRRLPARRRVPVRTYAARSRFPTWEGVADLSRKASTVGREKVFSPRILESSVMMSSVMPSRRYSSSFTPLKFSKYKTASDFVPLLDVPAFESVDAAAATAFLPDSRSLFRRIKSVFSSVADWQHKVRFF